MVQELFSIYLKRKGGSATRMFGADGIMVNGNVMMFFWKSEHLVMRVDEKTGKQALQIKDAAYFSPMEGGKVSKNWIAIPAGSLGNSVMPIAEAAYEFASSLPPKEIRKPGASKAPAKKKSSAKKAPASKKAAAVKKVKGKVKAAPKKKTTVKPKKKK